MRIVIDTSQWRAALEEPDDFGRFSVTLSADSSPAALAAVVHQTGLGRLGPDGRQVAVVPGRVRLLAGAAATSEWEEGFAAMCAYAAGKGWVADDGAILAHIEGLPAAE